MWTHMEGDWGVHGSWLWGEAVDRKIEGVDSHPEKEPGRQRELT